MRFAYDNEKSVFEEHDTTFFGPRRVIIIGPKAA